MIFYLIKFRIHLFINIIFLETSYMLFIRKPSCLHPREAFALAKHSPSQRQWPSRSIRPLSKKFCPPANFVQPLVV
jgi:hypothetical protein